MTILVIAEHDNCTLAAASLNTLGAAAQLGSAIEVLVAGQDCLGVAQQAAGVTGVTRVLHSEAEHYRAGLAENLAVLVATHAANFSHILAPATTFGKNLCPRIAALLDVAQVSDICAIDSSDTFKRPIYAGSIIATVRATDAIKVITVRPTAFGAATLGNSAPIEALAPEPDTGKTRLIGRTIAQSERPELATAKVVVAGGRGLGSAENFQQILTPLADALDAAIGASRAAVDAGFASNDAQVGQTGKAVAPNLYIAVGISGAIQHLAGMKDSKIIVAINKDADAPIFQIADYGIVGDLFQLLPELTAKLKQQ